MIGLIVVLLMVFSPGEYGFTHRELILGNGCVI